MSKDSPAEERLREQIVEMLHGASAHVSFEKAVEGLKPEFRGARAANCPHTAWRLVEHLRIAQNDILEFTRDARHKSPPWPQGYWPQGDQPSTPSAWDESIALYKADRQVMIDLISDLKTALCDPLPHGEGQTPAREAMLLVDHTAYHIGQLILLRQVLGAWHQG